MDENTVGGALRRTALAYPDLEAVVAVTRRLSFAELDAATDRLACGLLDLGIGPGDHVGLWLPTSPEWIIAFGACARIGAVVVPVNTRYHREEAEYVFKKADLALIIAQRRMWSIDAYDMLCTICPELGLQRPGDLSLRALPRLRSIVLLGDDAATGTISHQSLIDRPSDARRVAEAEAKIREQNVLLICFTSGSTGRPKGVVHTHRTLRHSRRLASVLHMTVGHRHLANWPMHHVAGLFIVLVPAIACAGTMVLMPQWDGAQALRLIEDERVTVFGGISTHFVDLVDAMPKVDANLSSLEVAYVGGATIARETFEIIMGTLGLKRLLSTYGMTENTVCTALNGWDDPPEICRLNKAPVITSGPVKIVDPITLHEVPAGESGEIWCSGPTVMEGYYGDPDATRAVLTEDGWLRTGDLGRLDAAGYLGVTGRLKDIVKVGGTNVSPAEVENYIMTNLAVKSTVVVGVPDRRLGEVCFAYVQLQSGAVMTEVELMDFCRPLMASYKVPRHVQFVTEFPRLSTGKIERKVLVDRAAALVIGIDADRPHARA